MIFTRKCSRSFGTRKTCVNKANISSFLKLTLTSQLKTNDKVDKIFQIFNDRNAKFVEYLTDILFKNELAVLSLLAIVTVGLKDITSDGLAQIVRELIDGIDEYSAQQPKIPDPFGNLKKCIGISRQIETAKAALLK